MSISSTAPHLENKDNCVASSTNKSSTASTGHTYSCKINKKQLAGIILLIIAVIALVLACIAASGLFGGGKMGFLASGIALTSLLLFGIAAYLLKPESKKHTTFGELDLRIN